MQARVEDVQATRSVAMGYLRGFVTLLVVVHHAALPYLAGAPPRAAAFAAPPYLWGAFPVIDANRWGGFDLLVGYDDTFFMSLMFFVSGLFVPGALERRGPGGYVASRALRLGVPFVVCAALLAPLTYFASYLQLGPSEPGFIAQWTSLDGWPAGPAWFLWVLLVLGAVCALLGAVAPRFTSGLGKLAGKVQRPVVFFLVMVGLTSAAYLPLARAVDPTRWAHVGPFFLQTSRALHYAVWFFAGVGVGAHGLDRGLLAPNGPLARRWWLWLVLSVGAYIAELSIVDRIFSAFMSGTLPAPELLTLANVGFVVTCAASCLLFVALFVRFARSNRFFESLSRSAYGIYLVHFAFVSWVAYGLLNVAIPGVVKGLLVAVVAALLSWGTSAALRRVPGVRRVLA